MTQAIYSINCAGNLKNIGRDFRSYDYGTVEKCAGLFLGDNARKFVLRTRKLGSRSTSYEWDQNSVILYADNTPNAHEAVLRVMRIGDVDTIPGYVFHVASLGIATDLKGIFDSREEMEAYVASVDQETADNLFVRIVPLNEVL